MKIPPSHYESYDEEDNWDNTNQICKIGYYQQGTKEKNGNRVPNCVPIVVKQRGCNLNACKFIVSNWDKLPNISNKDIGFK